MGDLLGLGYSLTLELEQENKKLRKRLERLEEEVKEIKDKTKSTTVEEHK